MIAHMAKIEINGEKYPIRATFGALAEIEDHFKIGSISQIGEIFNENVSGRDLMDFMEILLRFGGNENSKELAAQTDGVALQEAMNHLGSAMGVNENPGRARLKQKRASRSTGKKP